MRKYKLLIIYLSVLALLPAGCGISKAKLIVSRSPRIAYIKNIDKELDLSDGELTFISALGSEQSVPMKDANVEVIEEIDFSEEGVYIIILKYRMASCSYGIQVINDRWPDKEKGR